MNHWIEGAGVLFGIAYLLLAIREQRLCWVAGGISSLLFLYLFTVSALPAQALLQGYYIAVSAHGWWHWGRDDGSLEGLAIQRWTAPQHLLAVASLAALSALTLYFREEINSIAVLDVSIAWSSVLATWMVARKVLENWIYWILIDAAAAGLYLASALPATAGLYVVFTLLAIQGWRQWFHRYRLANAD